MTTDTDPIEAEEQKEPSIQVPQWVEFVRLTKENLPFVATKFFGDQAATPASFIELFGVDLEEYLGHYFEIDVSWAPEGPLVAGKLSHILVIRQSKTGQSYKPYSLYCDGFFNAEMTRAWIEAEKWDAATDDNLMTDMQRAEANHKKVLQQMEKIAAERKNES